MTLAEYQTLLLYTITTGVFLGFIISLMITLFGKK